ncbi:MAG TPA: methyltransferase domain-containing protein [Solirubrobacteraceae bacterium]|nr:methyltransferase domain-containing protein [Solirubrobacteraceae bacterium]
MDHEDFRAASREQWEGAAAGWGARRATFQAAAEPVSAWMVDALDPQPGETVLELAAGPGDTGLLAAARIAPGGRLISTDGAEAMVEVARARAAELGVENAEFRQMEAEWIDLGAASVDGVLCRYGYMLLADPEAALRETRRVLRPGGRVALAAWDAPERNPWMSTIGAELVAQGLSEPPASGAPGPFSFSAPGRIEELLDAAGFAEWRVDAVDHGFAAASFDDWWEFQYDQSPTLRAQLADATPEQRDALYEGVAARVARFARDDGSLWLPARTLVALAEA